MSNNFDYITNKSIVFDGDFNLFFETKLEALGVNPFLKKESLSKSMQIKEMLHLCDIWGKRNLNTKHFIFCQQHTL